ncbi:MAG: hypothetical protein RIN56_19985 [Sporomusaceae bacterium]|nr:hypothetical protein [Sporomusaceae bacterium]
MNLLEIRLLATVSIIGLVFCAFSWYTQYLPGYFDSTIATQDWWKNGLLNTGTGMITSVIVVILYNRILAKHEADRRNRRILFAFERLGTRINGVLFTLYELHKGTALVKPDSPINTFEDIFDDAFFTNVSSFSIESSWGPITINTFVEQFIKFYEMMDRTIKDCSDCMDHETLLLLDKLTTSEFMDYVKLYPIKEQKKRDDKEKYGPFWPFVNDPAYFTFRGRIAGSGGFKEYITDLIELIRLHNIDATRKILPEVSFGHTSIAVGGLREKT